MKRLACAAALCALLAAPAAQAIEITAVNAGGNQVDTTFTGPGHLAVDVGWLGDLPVSVSFRIDDSEATLGVSFSSIVSELRGGAALRDLNLRLSGNASFGPPGSALSLGLDDVPLLGSGPQSITLGASALGTTELYLGDALPLAGARPWTIGFGATPAGSEVTLTISAVPEPHTLALWLAGLAAVAVRGARRR